MSEYEFHPDVELGAFRFAVAKHAKLLIRAKFKDCKDFRMLKPSGPGPGQYYRRPDPLAGSSGGGDRRRRQLEHQTHLPISVGRVGDGVGLTAASRAADHLRRTAQSSDSDFGSCCWPLRARSWTFRNNNLTGKLGSEPNDIAPLGRGSKTSTISSSSLHAW